jgi:hypothetical protein
MRFGALVWGIGIYAAIFLLWSGFTVYGFVEGTVPRITGLLVLVVLSLYAGRSLRLHSWRDVLPYSIAWTIEVAILDIILSVPFTGWALFLDWNVWVGYSMILLVPLFAPMSRRASTAAPEHHGA